MIIQFIYTFENRPQSFLTFPFVEPILQDIETLFKFAITPLDKDDLQELVKISSAIIFDDDKFELPLWYIECNGKLWVKDGILI